MKEGTVGLWETLFKSYTSAKVHCTYVQHRQAEPSTETINSIQVAFSDLSAVFFTYGRLAASIT